MEKTILVIFVIIGMGSISIPPVDGIGLIEAITNLVNNLASLVSLSVAGIFTTISGILNELFQFASQILPAILQDFITAISNAIQNISDENICKALAGIVDIIEERREAVVRLTNDIIARQSHLEEALSDIELSVLEALVAIQEMALRCARTFPIRVIGLVKRYTAGLTQCSGKALAMVNSELQAMAELRNGVEAVLGNLAGKVASCLQNLNSTDVVGCLRGMESDVVAGMEEIAGILQLNETISGATGDVQSCIAAAVESAREGLLVC